MRVLFKNYRKRMIIFFILTIILALFKTLTAFIIKTITESIENPINYIYISLGTIGFVLLQAIIQHFQQYLTSRLSVLFSYELKKNIAINLSKSSINQYGKNATGYYLSKITTQVSQIESSYIYSILWGFYLLIQLLFALIASFIIDVKLTFFILVLTFPAVLIPQLLKKIIINVQLKFQEIKQQESIDVLDYLDGAKELKFSNLSTVFKKKLITVAQYVADGATNNIKTTNCVSTLSNLWSDLSYFGVWLAGIAMVISGSIKVSDVIAFTQLMSNISFPLHSSIDLITSIISGRALYEELNIFLENININIVENISFIENQEALIYLNEMNLSFNEKNIVKISNQKFYDNKKYLIIGPSGSGKSTLLKNIVGEQFNFEGEIKLQGRDMNSFYSKIGYIPQNGHIFNDSVGFNIALNDNYDVQSVQEILDKVGLSNWNHERKIEYSSISGGERQRLFLARSLYKNPKFLIIDEVTSSLDKESLKVVEELIFNMKIGLIYITHRFTKEIYENFDELLEIKNGELFRKTI